MQLMNRAEVTDWAQASKHLWLFLDYDGTLADFAPTPFDVEPNLRVISLMEQLALKTSLRITVLSGRMLKHIHLLLPVRGIYLAGTYGIEILTPTGNMIDRVDYKIIRPVLETIKPKWAGLIEGKKGFFLEDKGWSLAMHARFAGEGDAESVLARAKEVSDTASFKENFRMLGGHRFLEAAPRLASKKNTVTYLLNRYPFEEARLIYIGDDDKDEEAFPVIHANNGIALKVLQPSQLSRPTEADFCFNEPSDVLEWLQELD